MTQDNLLSFARALLILIGSYIVGHNLFGHAVDSSTWQIIAGAVVTLASTIWGIASKTTNIEGVESAVRSVITSVGGLFVSAGVLSGDNLNAILGLVTALAPAVQSALSKSKNSQIASGTIKTTVTGKALKMILILFLAGIGLKASAQSMFKPLPHYKAPIRAFAEMVVGPADSLPSISTGNWQGFRFAGPDIMFAVPDFSMWTGLGIDYVWAKANTATQKWDYDYTVGIRATGGANLGSPTIKTLGGIGARVTLFKGLLALGAIYNLTLRHSQAAIGNPAALIPGLN